MRTCGYPTDRVLILSTSATLSNWPESVTTQPDATTRLGGWLFRHRTLLPGPVALVIVMLPGSESASPFLVGAGVAITVVGELIRLWGVHHIGAISRTRSERLGPLVASGPFALMRNPLYVGNILLWVGFAIAARMLWLAPFILVLLALEYHAIVRWEERLLESRLGEAYRSYAARVPRWIPTLHHSGHGGHGGKTRQDPTSVSPESSVVPSFSWRETIFSERGTFVATAAGYVLLWLKARS
jgi:protein-S-isoprenylcysteine O-methyltransferase Ste14